MRAVSPVGLSCTESASKIVMALIDAKAEVNAPDKVLRNRPCPLDTMARSRAASLSVRDAVKLVG